MECTFDQIAQTFAVAFALAKSIDDQKIGSGIERVGDPGACVLQPADIQPAAAGIGVEILRQQQFFSAMNQHGGEAGVGALPGLYHSDDAKASRVHVGREIAQDRIGIVNIIVEKGSEVASVIKHGPDHHLRDILPRNVALKAIHPKRHRSAKALPVLTESEPGFSPLDAFSSREPISASLESALSHAWPLGMYLPRMHL